MRVHRDLAFLAAALAVCACACLIVRAMDEADAEAVQKAASVSEVSENIPSAVQPFMEGALHSSEPDSSEPAIYIELESEPEPEPVSLGEFKITHYCPCSKCCGPWADGYTFTGTKATQGRTIAVDPDVIPYGTEVLIRYEDGTEHTYIAEDFGGAIKQNRIDVFMDSHEAALVEGVKYAEVFVREEVVVDAEND